MLYIVNGFTWLAGIVSAMTSSLPVYRTWQL